VHPDPNFAGLHEVGDLLRRGEACQHGGERNREKQLLHVAPKISDAQEFQCATPSECERAQSRREATV
jgi:hypothetical protein